MSRRPSTLRGDIGWHVRTAIVWAVFIFGASWAVDQIASSLSEHARERDAAEVRR